MRAVRGPKTLGSSNEIDMIRIFMGGGQHCFSHCLHRPQKRARREDVSGSLIGRKGNANQRLCNAFGDILGVARAMRAGPCEAMLYY